MFLWIGLNDKGQENNFRLTNGSAYNPTNNDQPALYRWKQGEPNDAQNNEDCAIIFKESGVTFLNDFQCDKDYYSIIASNPPMHGLCEITTYKCIPS